MSRTGILIVEDECLVARDIQGMLDALGSAVAIERKRGTRFEVVFRELKYKPRI